MAGKRGTDLSMPPVTGAKKGAAPKKMAPKKAAAGKKGARC